MPYSIELRFDESAEAEIKQVWKKAAKFFGTDYLLQNGVIPHIALLVGDETLAGVYDQLMPPVANIELDGLQFFAAGDVAYLSAKVGTLILKWHQAIYELAMEANCPIDAFYTPAKWIPHCTVAQGCTLNKMKPFSTDKISAPIASLILVKYPPTRLLSEKFVNKPTQ